MWLTAAITQSQDTLLNLIKAWPVSEAQVFHSTSDEVYRLCLLTSREVLMGDDCLGLFRDPAARGFDFLQEFLVRLAADSAGFPDRQNNRHWCQADIAAKLFPIKHRETGITQIGQQTRGEERINFLRRHILKQRHNLLFLFCRDFLHQSPLFPPKTAQRRHFVPCTTELGGPLLMITR